MRITGPIPDHILRQMNPEDRRSLGREARTMAECQADNSVKLERELHKLIWNELSRREIFFVHSRMDRKTTNQVGTPDFIFSLPPGRPVALEVKIPGNTLSDEQEAVRTRMLQNGWSYHVVYSFKDAVKVIQTLQRTSHIR